MASRAVIAAGAGLMGGALGLWAMKVGLQGTKKMMARARPDADGEADDTIESDEERGAPDDEYMAVTDFRPREGEPATGALARMVYERVRGEELDEEREEALGAWVHRGYGEAQGVLYALLASGRGWGVKGGAAFGFLLWALGDELLVPLLGLSKKPTAMPLDAHLPPLVAHLAYGAALGLVVEATDRLLAHEG